MDRNEREYGKGGWIGIGTPQANPTMEAEFRRMLPADTELLIARLQGGNGSSEQRMIDYLETLPQTLKTYDTLKPDVFGFGNTGSSYLVGAKREAEVVAAAEAGCGYPIITAAQAVLATFQALSATKIAILAPYPQPIVDASVAFWEAAGLTISAVKRLAVDTTDTRNIYNIRSGDALTALRNLPTAEADAVLLSGTGMPSLAVVRQAGPALGKPIVSSNYCLAWALLRAVGIGSSPWDANGPTVSIGQSSG